MVLIVVTALLYGLTDLLLTSIEYITLFSALFILITFIDKGTEYGIKRTKLHNKSLYHQPS